MTGNEFLHEVSRERLEQIVKLYCCPEDVNIKTEYSCDENTCCDDYMGVTNDRNYRRNDSIVYKNRDIVV